MARPPRTTKSQSELAESADRVRLSMEGVAAGIALFRDADTGSLNAGHCYAYLTLLEERLQSEAEELQEVLDGFADLARQPDEPGEKGGA